MNDSDDTDTDDNKSNMKIEKVVIPETEPLNKEFTDNTFWSVDNTAEAEFELRVMELERKCLENPDLDIEVMYFELFHPHFA